MKFIFKKTSLAVLSPLLAFAFSSSSFADPCDSLLKTGIYNITQGASQADSEWMSKSTFCSADYSNASNSSATQASIEASIPGVGGGGASGSVSSSQIITTQRNVCTLGFDSGKYSSMASSYSKTIYQGALDSWDKCLALNNKGVKFEAQPDNNMLGVTVTLTAIPGTTSKLSGVFQSGLGKSICKTTLPPISGALGRVITMDEATVLKLSSASSLVINCNRLLSADAAGNKFADEQTLKFNTSAGVYIVPMVAIGALSRSSLNKAQAQISAAALANVQAVLSVTNKKVANQATQIASLIDAAEWVWAGTCPVGWNDVGSGGMVRFEGEPAVGGFAKIIHGNVDYWWPRLCRRPA